MSSLSKSLSHVSEFYQTKKELTKTLNGMNFVLNEEESFENQASAYWKDYLVDKEKALATLAQKTEDDGYGMLGKAVLWFENTKLDAAVSMDVLSSGLSRAYYTLHPYK